MPYISPAVNGVVRRRLAALVRYNYPQLNLRVIFRNSFTIGSFFSYKDRVLMFLKSNVVYMYKYGQCEATYFGETIRHPHYVVRLSPRTGRPINSQSNSHIRSHVHVVHPQYVVRLSPMTGRPINSQSNSHIRLMSMVKIIHLFAIISES